MAEAPRKYYLDLEDLELVTPRAKLRLRRGKGAYTVKTPSSLSAARVFLRDLSDTEMVRLCVNCHR